MAKKTSKKKKKSKGKRPVIANLADLVHSLVEKGADSTEEIHRSIADLPIKALESVMPKAAKDIGKIQHRSIGAVYDTIRQVNDEVERLAEEILKEAPAIEQTAREAAASARRAVGSVRKTAAKATRKTTRKTPRKTTKKTARRKTTTGKRATKRRPRSS